MDPRLPILDTELFPPSHALPMLAAVVRMCCRQRKKKMALLELGTYQEHFLFLVSVYQEHFRFLSGIVNQAAMTS